jgi:hypothetical protein
MKFPEGGVFFYARFFWLRNRDVRVDSPNPKTKGGLREKSRAFRKLKRN